MVDFLNILLLAGAILLLLAVSELLYYRLHLQVEYTRKLVHTGIGFIILLFPVLFNSHWPVFILCSAFLVILVLCKQYRLFNSVNAINRFSVGAFVYPVSVYCCFLVYQYFDNHKILYYLPVLILAISDSAAAIAGKKFPIRKFRINKDYKSIMGCGMFFITAFLLSIFCYQFFQPGANGLSHLIVLKSVFIAAVSTITEAISSDGLDNLTVPVSVLGTIIFMEKILQDLC